MRVHSVTVRTAPERGRPHLIAEATDFGFGPAHALITLAECVEGLVDLTILSSGNALDLLRRAIPYAGTRTCPADPSEWLPVLADLDPGSTVLTMSVPFGEAARRQGAWVAVVDQLHWMWNHTSSSGPDVDLYLAPDYFGRPDVPPGSHRVAPLVGRAFRHRVGPRTTVGPALVAFGGMSVMGTRRANDRYARWVLELLFPVLTGAREVTRIDVVGGSPALTELLTGIETGGKEIRVHPVLAPGPYSELLTSTAHQFMSPGLATIYETSALGLSPFFLPSTTKSGLMQSQDVLGLGYPHVGVWRWQGDVLPQIIPMPQPEALDTIVEAVSRSFVDQDSGWLTDAKAYLDGPRAPLDLPQSAAPDAADLLLQELPQHSR